MQVVHLQWNRPKMARSGFDDLMIPCTRVEVVAHLSVTESGVRQLLRCDFRDGFGPEDLSDSEHMTFETTLHGEEGESGILQSKLEEAGINYTGSGFKGCKNSWDKETCKNILKQHNLPTPKFFVYETFQEIIESQQQLNLEFKKGAFIKPCKEGSSIDTVSYTHLTLPTSDLV